MQNTPAVCCTAYRVQQEQQSKTNQLLRAMWANSIPALSPEYLSPHLPPGFDALVDVVRERAAGQESSTPLGHMKVPILQHDLPLAYDNQRGPTELHPLKDVVFSHLEQPQDDGQEGQKHCLPTQGGSVPTPHCWSPQCRQKTPLTALPAQRPPVAHQPITVKAHQNSQHEPGPAGLRLSARKNSKNRH